MELPIFNNLIAKAEPLTEAESEELARLARALGHPHRVAILQYLRGQNSCLCGQIVDVLPVAQSTVSQHLKKLKEAGWIAGEVEGPRTCYCVNPGVIERFQKLIHKLGKLTSLSCCKGK
jgi:DNA-binding transcriptional ArsR family regulator